MSRFDNMSERVQSLFLAACEENMPQEQLTELEHELSDDREARLLIDYMQLDTDLRTIMHSERALEKSLDLIGIVAQPSGRPAELGLGIGGFLGGVIQNVVHQASSGWIGACLALTMLIGLIVWYESPRPRAPRDFRLAVGRVTGMVRCCLTTDGLATREHDSVNTGDRFHLTSGLMEITYRSGAKVILQGPANYEVVSENGGRLTVGKLTGKVTTPQAKGFCVRTPTAAVTDLGTEFGVEVGEQGVTRTHVFVGEVRLARLLNTGAVAEEKTIQAGQAGQCSDNAIRLADATPNDVKQFVRQISDEVKPAKTDAEQAGVTNLIVDGSFEAAKPGDSGLLENGFNVDTLAPAWRFYAVGGAKSKYTITEDSSYVSDGGKALIIERTAGAGDGADAGADQWIDPPTSGLVAPGHVYNMWADMKLGPYGTGEQAVLLQAIQRNSAGGCVTRSTYGIGMTKNWTRVGLSMTAAMAVTQITPHFGLYTSGGQSVAIDNIVMQDVTSGERMLNGRFENGNHGSLSKPVDWRFFDTEGGNAGMLVIGAGRDGSTAFLLTRSNFSGDSGLDIHDNLVPVIAGEKLTVSFDAKSLSGKGALEARQSFRSKDGAWTDVPSMANPPSDAYKRFTFELAVPVDAASFNLGFRIAGEAGSILIDNVSVSAAATPK